MYGEEVKYDPPIFGDEEIRMAIQRGLLGEQVCHVTIEQLKSPSPALTMQIFISLLQKLDVDTDHLGQPFFQADLNNPDYYQQSTFLAIHIPILFNRKIPQGAASKGLTTSDILYPKWKRLRKVLSMAINYLHFIDDGALQTWQEINAKSEEIHQKGEELINHNSKLETTLKEIDAYMVQHGAEHSQQNEELVDSEKEFQQIMLKKDEKQGDKETNKQILGKYKEELDSRSQDLEKLFKETDQVKLSLVTSPKRQLAERKEMVDRLNHLKDEFFTLQDDLSARERRCDQIKQTIEFSQHMLQQLADSQACIDKQQTLQNNLKKQEFEDESSKFKMTRLGQENDTLTHQISGERENLHRMKIRIQGKTASWKKQVADITSGNELLASQTQDKKSQRQSLEALIDEKTEQLKQNEVDHSNQMQKLNKIEENLKDAIAKTQEKTIANIKNTMGARIKMLHDAIPSDFNI